MKKIVALLVAAMMLFACAAATADTQIGQSVCAAHGTKCFSVLTVAVEDGVIVDAAAATETARSAACTWWTGKKRSRLAS